jgi:asparagine synthase (glutamine-hydrolysing)
MKADRMTMAASVELRVPFLDHRLVEYAAAVPSRMKLKAGRSKHLLREVAKDILPASTVSRGKMGFPTPLVHMFRSDLRAYCSDVLLRRRALQRGYFEPDVIRRVLTQHATGEADHSETIWRLLVLEQWHACFVDRSRQPAGETMAPLVSAPQATGTLGVE